MRLNDPRYMSMVVSTAFECVLLSHRASQSATYICLLPVLPVSADMLKMCALNVCGCMTVWEDVHMHIKYVFGCFY